MAFNPINFIKKQLAQYSTPTGKSFTNWLGIGTDLSYKPPVTGGGFRGEGTAEPAWTSQEDYINAALSGIAKPSGGANLSSVFSAYDQEANASKNELNSAIETKRNDLLTSIKRLREDIATSRAEKQQMFQSTRAGLEENAFMATRANRASAASRGLSGSGLEQLAQLQNMMKSNKAVSDVALKTRAEQDALTQNLTRSEQDTTTNLNNLTTEQKNALASINASLASKKTTAQQNANAQAAAASNAYQNTVAATKANAAQVYASMKAKATTVIDALKQGKLKTADKQAAQTDIQAAYASGLIDESFYNTLTKQIENLKKK
jgi:hypothetical protein